MSLYYNGGIIYDYIYNGVALSQMQYNGVDVWYKVNESNSALLSTGAIYIATSHGTRSPADKISNYAYIPSSSGLTVGKRYGYIIFTSGERAANRQLYDGTVIYSRGYNSGYTSTILNGANVYDFKVGTNTTNKCYSYHGAFTYNPATINSGSGSAYGQLIAKYTYNVSDAGKGGIVVYVYPLEYLADLCNKTGRPVRR